MSFVLSDGLKKAKSKDMLHTKIQKKKVKYKSMEKSPMSY